MFFSLPSSELVSSVTLTNLPCLSYWMLDITVPWLSVNPAIFSPVIMIFPPLLSSFLSDEHALNKPTTQTNKPNKTFFFILNNIYNVNNLFSCYSCFVFDYFSKCIDVCIQRYVFLLQILFFYVKKVRNTLLSSCPLFPLKSLLVVVKKKKGWALFVSCSFNVLTPLKFNVNVFASSFHLLIFVLY